MAPVVPPPWLHPLHTHTHHYQRELIGMTFPYSFTFICDVLALFLGYSTNFATFFFVYIKRMDNERYAFKYAFDIIWIKLGIMLLLGG